MTDPSTTNVVTDPDCDQIAIPRVVDVVVCSEPALVDQARAGDLAAFASLIGRHRDRFLRYATHMLGSVEDAEEAVQDALVRAHRALGNCDRERFSAWAFRIVVNRCRTVARRRQWWWTRSASLEQADRISAPDATADPAWREEISRALRVLSEDQREAFLLKHVDELSYEEISRVTGASIPALKMRVNRACEKMRLALEAAK